MMIWFLLKGMIRDRHRSLFPVIIVVGGVAVTVLLYCMMTGVMDDVLSTNAKLDAGHLKIATEGYFNEIAQLPNDLAIGNVEQLLDELRREYPSVDWNPRIKFGGLLDFPDEQGETRAQGPVFGIAIDMISGKSHEIERLNLRDSLVTGRLPQFAGEALISHRLAQNMDARVGDVATLISATADGSMAVHNFVIVGTINFGISGMDRNGMIADISDIQYALDMPDSAGEVLGFFRNDVYDKLAADQIAADFSAKHSGDDELSLTIRTLLQQSGLGQYIKLADRNRYIIVTIFIVVMSIVLWNAGLMSGLRRYGEMGIRLAFGESKPHVYWTLIAESFMIGLVGSVIGTLIGLAFSYYMQVKGIDMSRMFEGSTMLWSSKMRARITWASLYLGFITGILATFLGSTISGIGIFRRQTSQLFKELET